MKKTNLFNFNQVVSINPLFVPVAKPVCYIQAFEQTKIVFWKNGMAIGYQVALNRLRWGTSLTSMANGSPE